MHAEAASASTIFLFLRQASACKGRAIGVGAVQSPCKRRAVHRRASRRPVHLHGSCRRPVRRPARPVALQATCRRPSAAQGRTGRKRGRPRTATRRFKPLGLRERMIIRPPTSPPSGKSRASPLHLQGSCRSSRPASDVPVQSACKGRADPSSRPCNVRAIGTDARTVPSGTVRARRVGTKDAKEGSGNLKLNLDQIQLTSWRAHRPVSGQR
jgi:hypothetical protein